MTTPPSKSETQSAAPARIKLKRSPERKYYSIADVADETELKPYVLRFWEKEFPMLRPKKNRAGNRTYQRKDIDMVMRIKHLLYKEGFTIDGARSRLKSELSGATAQPESVQFKGMLADIRSELEAIAAMLP